MVLGIIGTVLCAFVCSSDLQSDIKSYSMVCEVVLVVLILVMYYVLSHDIVQKVNKNIEIIGNLEKVEQINEKNNIDGKQVLKFLKRKDVPSKSKRQVRAALWVVICAIIIFFNCLILPLVLKCLGHQKDRIILSYFI